MKILVLLLLVGLTLASRNYQVYSIDKAGEYFEEFMKTYDKHYANEAEKAKRFEIFKKNLVMINQKNAYNESAIFGITMFSDLTNEEFINTYTGLRPKNIQQQTTCSTGSPSPSSAPDSWDWRDKQIISKPKNQLRCGSCWAFSAIGNVEAQYAKNHNGVLLDLSEQQLVDCDKSSFGCQGSPGVENAFMYMKESSGAMLEQDYPYQGVQGNCRFDSSKVKARVSDCIIYQTQSEEELKNILYNVGPLSIGIDATSLQDYQNGIIDCIFTQLNHAVLLVGYGIENGTPFWVIKNSWGEAFGEGGFVRVRRGVNACGMLDGVIVQSVVS